MQPQEMPTPNMNSWIEYEAGFRKKWNFPNCVGALDGKHVTMDNPPRCASLLKNYKNGFSLVLMALVDPYYKFIAVDIGAYGSNNDPGIFGKSLIGKMISKNRIAFPAAKPISDINGYKLPHLIVGDEAYPLRNNIMRPFPRRDNVKLPDHEAIFNYRLSRARRIVENAFGILSQRF